MHSAIIAGVMPVWLLNSFAVASITLSVLASLGLLTIFVAQFGLRGVRDRVGPFVVVAIVALACLCFITASVALFATGSPIASTLTGLVPVALLLVGFLLLGAI
jgi:CHASE2 domain-containing sensor protein